MHIISREIFNEFSGISLCYRITTVDHSFDLIYLFVVIL